MEKDETELKVCSQLRPFKLNIIFSWPRIYLKMLVSILKMAAQSLGSFALVCYSFSLSFSLRLSLRFVLYFLYRELRIRPEVLRRSRPFFYFVPFRNKKKGRSDVIRKSKTRRTFAPKHNCLWCRKFATRRIKAAVSIDICGNLLRMLDKEKYDFRVYWIVELSNVDYAASRITIGR